MDSDYTSGLENPLYSELKYFCRKIQEAYNDLKEELTPYRDDRFYRLAPMRLYTLSKRHFVLVFLVFLICFGLTVFIGIAGKSQPSVIKALFCSLVCVGNMYPAGLFQLDSPPLTTYNQQLWLTCVMQVENSNSKPAQRLTQIVASLLFFFIIQKCDEIIVLHLGYLNYTRYKVSISFKGLENITYEIKVNFMWKTYNPTFSQVEIWFRFVFVVLTFMVTCMFAHSLRKFSMRDWGIEQKWMSILLPLLLLYNDPFFPLSFLVNSWFPGTLDAFFQALFLCALLLFWLCVYHGIRAQGERKFLTFYLPKLIIVGLLWLSAVTLGIWQTVNELQDPTYLYKVDIVNFQGMKVFFLIVVVLYILYLTFLIVRACSELKNMPYSDLRLKFLTALTFVVLVISVVILYLRFGAKALQDNFVAELSTHYQNYIFSAEYQLNFYPSTACSTSIYSQLKDNPAFSMLNDSDDEVIYGSDYEDTPLQNGRANKVTAKYRDESDSD
uniref:Transmembrane protein 181 n=1 Tax=Nothobranchius furzeri TaxID=105023 RepID=A0A8C6K8N2_NOTFU